MVKMKNRRLPNLELSNPKPFAREFIVLALATHGFQELDQSPSTPGVVAFRDSQRAAALAALFLSDMGVKILHVWRHSVTQNGLNVSLKGWFSMIFWLLGGHMFHSTFLPKNGTTCYPSIKSIAQQPLIFEHREGFPRLCGPNFVVFLPPNKWVPRS